MPRFTNPYPEFDFQGETIAYGELYFYNSGTNTPKTTYKNAAETIPNTNPVLLDASGRVPNIFFTGTAKVVLKTSPDAEVNPNQVVWEADPVGAQVGLNEPTAPWTEQTIYQKNDIVEGADGKLYLSTVGNNQGNNPALGVPEWAFIQFLQEWSSLQTFQLNNFCTYNGTIYRSLVSGDNIGNQPDTSPAQWEVVTLTQAIADTIYLKQSENLADLDNVVTARANLDLTKQSSAFDSTAGVLLTPGAFGLGVTTQSQLNSDPNTTEKTGFSRLGNTNVPKLNSGAGMLNITIDDGTGNTLNKAQIYLGADQTTKQTELFYRGEYNNAYQDWVGVWDTVNFDLAGAGYTGAQAVTIISNSDTQLTPTLGNVVYHANGNGVTAAQAATAIKGAKDGNIGNQSSLTPITGDLDTDVPSNSFFAASGSATNRWPGGSTEAGLDIHSQPDRGAQLGFSILGTAYFRTELSGTWQTWREFFHTGNTGAATRFNQTIGSISGGNLLSIGSSNLPVIETSRNTVTAQTHFYLYNPNGQVGSITTNGTATSYNTSSDNRLKTVIGKPSDADIDAKFNDIYDTFTLFNWNNDPQGEAVWGFLAHDVIDKGLDFGSEGEGPRNLNIGDVYETIPAETEERPVMETITDKDGNEVEQQATDADGNLLFETVVVKEAIEKRVTPAGVDQSKVVPYLVAKIEKQDRKITQLENIIDSLITRLNEAGL